MSERSLIDNLEDKLERLSKLGNEPHYGNSIGNTLAIECLGILRQNLPPSDVVDSAGNQSS